MIQQAIFFINNIDFNWSLIESLAVLFSILYVILASKENIWCWGAGAISALLYVYICFLAGLYAETGLQVFYLIMAFYGFYNWNKKEQYLQIKEWKSGKHLFILFTGAIMSLIMGYYLTNFSSAKMPITDSFTTVFSIIATYMVVKKILENWLYWIIINLTLVYLYFSRGLHLTSLLFIIYTVIAVIGYFSWLKKIEIDD